MSSGVCCFPSVGSSLPGLIPHVWWPGWLGDHGKYAVMHYLGIDNKLSTSQQSLWPKKSLVSWGALGKGLPVGYGKWSCPSTRALWGTSRDTCCVWFWFLGTTETQSFWSIQWWATKIIKGLEDLSYAIRLRELGLLSLEKRWRRRELINVYKYMMKGVKRMKPGSSWWCQAIGQAAMGRNSWCSGSSTWIRGETSLLFRTMHWNSLPREHVESPSMEILKNCQDAMLYHVL